MKSRPCTDCGVTKPLSAFRKSVGYADGHQRICTDCYTVRRYAWRARGGLAKENAAPSAKVRKNAYRTTPAGKAHALKIRKAEVARVTTWARKNPAKRAAQIAAYRARKAGAPGTHTAEEVAELFEANQGKCAYCPEPATQVDHVIALSRGGTNDIDNLLPSCRPCNASKKNTPLFTWLARRAA